MLPFDPKKPLYGFTARAPHAKRRIHLFKDGMFVYFRLKNAPLDWWGVFWGDYSVGWAIENKEWTKVEKIVQSHLRCGHIWRVFEMNDPREGEQRRWRIIWRPDLGSAKDLDQTTESYRAYFWPRPAKLSLWKTSTSALQRHFEAEWHDPKSDVRTALTWCDLSDEERDFRGVRWERGSQNELERLIRAALHVLPLWDEVAHQDQQDKITLVLAWDEQGQCLENQSRHLLRASPNWKRWNTLHQRIEERNWGVYTVEGNRQDWTIPWVKHEPPASNYRMSAQWLEIGRPTQHEYLEGTLILRDWLRDNAPDLLDDWF